MKNRHVFRSAVLAPGMALAAAACAPVSHHDTGAAPLPAPAPAALASDPALDRAQAAATAFSGLLRGRLQAAMNNGGPAAAVEACNAEAPRIADAVMAEQGVRLGRVALPGRNRKPAHAAGDWQLATLEAFRQAVDGGASAAEQVSVIRDGLPDGIVLRMMRGIATEPGCLACHGTQPAPEVHAAIAALYPDDRATGFALGDLRGGLWVEVPTAPNPEEDTH